MLMMTVTLTLTLTLILALTLTLILALTLILTLTLTLIFTLTLTLTVTCRPNRMRCACYGSVGGLPWHLLSGALAWLCLSAYFKAWWTQPTPQQASHV